MSGLESPAYVIKWDVIDCYTDRGKIYLRIHVLVQFIPASGFHVSISKIKSEIETKGTLTGPDIDPPSSYDGEKEAKSRSVKRN